MLNLSGKFSTVRSARLALLPFTIPVFVDQLYDVQNKTLTGSSEGMMELQGVGWMKRKAVGIAGVTHYIKHYKGRGRRRAHRHQERALGGLKAVDENRALTWEEQEVAHELWGPITERAKRVKLEEVDDEYLKTGWLPEAQEHGFCATPYEEELRRQGVGDPAGTRVLHVLRASSKH